MTRKKLQSRKKWLVWLDTTSRKHLSAEKKKQEKILKEAVRNARVSLSNLDEYSFEDDPFDQYCEAQSLASDLNAAGEAMDKIEDIVSEIEERSEADPKTRR